MSFVFYAARTSGASPCYDQILNFAAIRTDAEFGEVERFEVSSRLLPHIVASPATLLACRLDHSTITAASRPSHYEMACRIYRTLGGWSPSTFVGFDSLGADEHFLRQCLYQTLHPPYLTSCDGNTRTDVARIIQASLSIAPGAVTVPRTADGGYDLELNALASSNGLPPVRPHSAMEHAEAALRLARLLNERAAELWSTAMRFSKKAAVIDFIENERIFAYPGFYFGKPRCWLVTWIGTNPANAVERYVFNLKVDPDPLQNLSQEELVVRVSETPKPVRILKTNGAPVLLPEYDAPPDAAGKEVDGDELLRRADALKDDHAFCKRLIDAYVASHPPREASEEVEERLYERFLPDEDLPIMERFHAEPWELRGPIVRNFSDDRLKRIGQRLIYFERPRVLSHAKRELLDQMVALRLLGLQERSPWMTYPRALNEVDELLTSAAEEGRPFLQGYRAYLVAERDRLQELAKTRD